MVVIKKTSKHKLNCICFYIIYKDLGIDTERYAILPSVGASNCINICSVLHGQGCCYIAALDYDTAGAKTDGEYLRKDMMFEQKAQYCYLADVSQEDVEKKTYKESPYMIEAVVTREEISRYCAETNTSSTIGKPLRAKLRNAIEFGGQQVGKQCKSNFEALPYIPCRCIRLVQGCHTKILQEVSYSILPINQLWEDDFFRPVSDVVHGAAPCHLVL